MEIYGGGYHEAKTESYGTYRKNKVNKAKERMQAILSGIKDSSLKPEHKKELKRELIKLIENDL